MNRRGITVDMMKLKLQLWFLLSRIVSKWKIIHPYKLVKENIIALIINFIIWKIWRFRGDEFHIVVFRVVTPRTDVVGCEHLEGHSESRWR